MLLLEPTLIEDDDDKEEPTPVSTQPKPLATTGTQSAIDLTAEFLRPLLTPENVANLVYTLLKDTWVYCYENTDV